MSTSSAPLRRRQIDRLLRDVEGLRTLATPPRGWIAEIRGVLGMRASQLAGRMDVSPSAVPQFERSEAEGSITLNTLQKAAAALDCRLVYAFVPNQGSFDDTVRKRAELIAQTMVGYVSHTMALEDQETMPEEQHAVIDDLAGDLVRRLPRELWDNLA